MGTKQFIEQTLSDYYKTCSVDKYGQVGTISAQPLFGDRYEEVVEYIKSDPIIRIGTYGYTYGTYKGISNYDISEPLYKVCQQNLSKFNKNFHRAMTSW